MREKKWGRKWYKMKIIYITTEKDHYTQNYTLNTTHTHTHTHLDITEHSRGVEVNTDREEIIRNATCCKIHSGRRSCLVYNRDAPHQSTVCSVVLVLTLALVDDWRGSAGGQGNGDDYLAQFKVAVLKVVLDVDVTTASAILLRPTVD